MNSVMQEFSPVMIRNIGIIAQIDAGKTTISERFLYYSGQIHRIGEVDNGNTVMDYLEEEKERGITIVAAVAEFPWKTDDELTSINLIDTPGHIDFTVEVERSLRIIDGAVVVLSAVEGVEAQTEKVWRQSDKYSVPKIAFVNKMDRLGADFHRTVKELIEKFPDKQSVPVQIPVGEESNFSGIIDLIEMKAIYFSENGEVLEKKKIPPELIDKSEEARDELISSLSECSDKIAEQYLNEQDISPEMIYQTIRQSVIEEKLIPVLVGSAKKNIGVQPLLDAVNRYLPSPEDKPTFQAHSLKNETPLKLNIKDKNFRGLIFKIVADKSSDLCYMRIYSGTLSLNDTVINSRTKEKYKIKRILRLFSKNITAVESASAGNIVGITGLPTTITGDTLCSPNEQVILEKITFPEPLISMAVEPKSSKDKKHLDDVLNLLCREDPTLSVTYDESTGQRIISGMGELHLEIKSHKIKNDFNLDVRFGNQRVAYRETLKQEILEITGKLEKNISDQDMFAEVKLNLIPVSKLEKGIEIVNKVSKNNSTPVNWIQAAYEALFNGLKTGGNWGYPLIYIKAEILEIIGEPNKTNENTIAGAVFNALNQAILQGTKILEPLVQLTILAPENTIGEISSYIQPKRAIIHSITTVGTSKQMICEVPLAEMFGFSKALPKLSGGRAAFSMEPCGYQEITIDELEKSVTQY
jgi:elongation factor G